MLVLTKPKLYWTFWLYWFCKNLCYVEDFGYIDSEKTYSYVEHFGYVDSVKTYNYFKHFGYVDSEKTYVTLNILASDNSMVLRKEECWRRRVGWETHQSKYLWHVAPTSGDDAWTLVCRLFISTTERVDNEWECCSSRRESCMPASTTNNNNKNGKASKFCLRFLKLWNDANKMCEQQLVDGRRWCEEAKWGRTSSSPFLFVGSGFETWRNRYKHKAWGSSMELFSGFVCKKLGTYALCLSTRVASGIFKRKPTCCFDTWSQEREKESSSSSQGKSPVSMKQTPLEPYLS